MPKKIKAPCIRGLKRFEKTGCPGVAWDKDTQQGCPAWNTVTSPDPDNPLKTISTSDCIDQWNTRFAYSTIAMLEGVQKSIESFRNGMVEDVGNEVVPKVDRGIKQMLSMVKNSQNSLG